ncbi:DUF4351 domain-containing protein, partial [Symplocastrum sp. BBK-W-15]
RMMALPEELQQSFEQKLTSYEEERKMPLLSRMEERGLAKGARQTLQSTIIRILQVRFETVPPELINEINSLEDILELERLVMTSVTINSVVDFGEMLSQNRNTNRDVG